MSMFIPVGSHRRTESRSNPLRRALGISDGQQIEYGQIEYGTERTLELDSAFPHHPFQTQPVIEDPWNLPPQHLREFPGFNQLQATLTTTSKLRGDTSHFYSPETVDFDGKDDFHQSTSSALMFTVENGDIECVRCHLKNGNHREEVLFQALETAIFKGFDGVAEILVQTLCARSKLGIGSPMPHHINQCLGKLLESDSWTDPKEVQRLLSMLTFFAVKEPCRDMLYSAGSLIKDLCQKFAEVSPDPPFMIFLAAVLRGRDSLASKWQASKEVLHFCLSKIPLYAEMVPRAAVSATSLALLLILRYGHPRSIQKLIGMEFSMVHACILALDNFCDAVDGDWTELELPYFILRYESRQSVSVYRETLRENLFQALTDLFATDSAKSTLLRFLYKPNIGITGDTSQSTDHLGELLTLQCCEDHARIAASPLAHPIYPSPFNFHSQKSSPRVIWPPDFWKWIPECCTEPQAIGTTREQSVMSGPDSHFLNAYNFEDLLVSTDLLDSCTPFIPMDLGDPVKAEEQDSWISDWSSLDGFSLDSDDDEMLRMEDRKTYAQACNENAGNMDTRCVESKLLQSYLDAVWAIGMDPRASVSPATGETILKKTLTIFKEQNPGSPAPIETVSLLRQVSHNAQCLAELEEPEVYDCVSLRAVGSVELLPVQCERWMNEVEILSCIDDKEIVKHKNLRYLIPLGDKHRFRTSRIFYSYTTGRVTRALEQSGPDSGSLVIVREFGRHSGSDWCIRRLEDFTKQIRKDPSHLAIYYNIIEGDQKWMLIRSACDWNLDEYIRRDMGAHFMNNVVSVFYQMLKGLEFMHQSVPILFHGNLKPTNVLIDSHGVVRLVDFGFGKLCAQKHNACGPCLLSDGTFHPICWKPPEFYSIQMTYRGLSDVHSTAMIAYYMLTQGKRHPFVTHHHMDISELNERVLQGNYSLEETIPIEATHLLHKMLEVEPIHRPPAAEVMKHPFFWQPDKRVAFLIAVAYTLIRNRLSVDPTSFAELEKEFTVSKKIPLSVNWKQTVPGMLHEDVELLEEQESSVVNLLLLLLEAYQKLSATRKLRFFLEAYPTLFMTVYSSVDNNYFWKNTKKIKDFFR